MTRQNEILLNQFGQGLIANEYLIERFMPLVGANKSDFFNHLIFLISQSKPVIDDVEMAIAESKLKSTYTPCVLLRKGVGFQELKKIADLPDSELEKTTTLFLNLFKIAYRRRFELEKNDPDKWWYWDFSDEGNIKKAMDIDSI